MTVGERLIKCRVWIESALNHAGGTHDFCDVVDGVLSGHMQLWMGKESCTVTELVIYPRKRVLHVFLAGGKLDEIMEIHDAMVEFAKANDCETITLAGRAGWKKILKKDGWQDDFLVMSKEL